MNGKSLKLDRILWLEHESCYFSGSRCIVSLYGQSLMYPYTVKTGVLFSTVIDRNGNVYVFDRSWWKIWKV